MQTNLSPEFTDIPAAKEAESILRKCVHCGFCTATCPTYQLLGDELDGPRGRIYLIKEVLEGKAPSSKTQQHLDRCLTCRNCETTCPSGVQYGRLLDIGRGIVEEKVERTFSQKALRWALRKGLTSALFGPAMRVAQSVRAALPKPIQAKIPPKGKRITGITIPVISEPAHWTQYVRSNAPSANLNRDSLQEALPDAAKTQRTVLLLAGCVQPSMAPSTNLAAASVLAHMGVHSIYAQGAGCCGALAHHLNAQSAALEQMRRNVDAWWPLLNAGVEALVMTASGCGVSVKEYGHLLANDPQYCDKARQVSGATQDLSEWLRKETKGIVALKKRLDADKVRKQGLQAYHPPCTLQHGQKLKESVPDLLEQLGFSIATAQTEAHLCCGSAGTYSVLNPALSNRLKERKLTHLQALQPRGILSANVGCITHLQGGTSLPVQHWIELLEHCLQV